MEALMAESLRRKRGKLLLVIALSILALAGGAGFSQRYNLFTRYYAYRFEHAPEAQRQAWLDKLVGMGKASVPRLLGFLRKDDGNLCSAARSGLEKSLAAWGPKDPRSHALADRLLEEHPSFSTAGQMAALQLLPELLDSENVETAAKARTVVAASLKDKTAELRFLGISVASRPELNLLPAVVPLLDDPDANVRRAALLVLGPVRETGAGGAEQPLVSSDDLLRWLHDPDPEVRSICEMSLRSSGRGLRDRDIRMGRMLKSPDPMERLKLLLALPMEEDMNLKAWLRRLSEDPDSAVRAGAARLAADRRVDFAERLEQMTQTDPDGTVRKIAEYYRNQYR
jgi:HEAT repeat protein